MSEREFHRIGIKVRFQDEAMDTFFQSALGQGTSGGIDFGELFHVASQIEDGDSASWTDAFAAHALRERELAETFLARGWRRAAGEATLKAFACYRFAWQFCPPGDRYVELASEHRACFRRAMELMELPVDFFSVPWENAALTGMRLRNADADAPTLLVIGGADSAWETLYFSIGRAAWLRGFNAVMVDLPGQGISQADGLYWTAEAERPVEAVVDVLAERFGVRDERLAMIGFSLGGYFVTRAVGHLDRFAAAAAATPLTHPGEVFRGRPRRTADVAAWKAGVSGWDELTQKMAGFVAEPDGVRASFLSLVGGGESELFARQGREWHEALDVPHKQLIVFDAASGADAHCQLNNPTRLAQEVCGWLGDVFAARVA